MGLMELVRFVTAHVFPEAMTANLHNQERQSHRAVDPSIDKPRHGTRARNESASVSEPVSSPDPLCTTTAPPQPVSNRTAGHPYNKPRSIEKCHAGTRPEQTTSVKTRANTNFEPIKVQLSKDEDLMDLDSTSSASDTYIDALADARKKNKILKGKLRAQSLTSDKEVAEAKGEIERWKMKYMQKRDLLREKDIEVRRLQKNYQDHEVSLRSLLNDLDSKLKRAQADLENQLRVNHNLENSLEDCKERIFRSQPFQGPTDKQLVDMYENLCDSIDKWVHRSVADDEDTIERFSKMQFDPTLHTTFGQYLTWHEIMAVSRMPQVGNIMIVSVIMRVVNMRVLRTGFLRLGLDPITNDALDGAVAALSKLDPAKDFEDCQSWRVDLHRALNVYCGRQSKLPRPLEACHNTILEALEMIGVSDEAVDDIRRGCESFLLEAMKLAEGMSLSMGDYIFGSAIANDAPAEDRIMFADGLKNYNVIDSRTVACLRSKSKPIADPNGKVGEMIFNVFPSIHRRDKATNHYTVLCKATVVVQFDHPIPSMGKTKATG